MYPETDVKPILIEKARLESIRQNLPELPEERTLRISKEYGINEQQSRQLVKDGHDELFEEIAQDRAMAAVAARTFLSTFRSCRRTAWTWRR